MNKCFVFLAATALAGCSSSSGNGNVAPPTPTSYSYNGTAAPASSTQSSAASDASANTQSVVGAAQASASNVNQTNAATLTETAPNIPTTITSDLGDAVALPRSPAAQVVGKLMKMKSTQLDAGSCNYTISGNTINYNNCNLSEDGDTITINGSLTATPTSLVWNIQITFSFSGDAGDGEGNVTENLSGSEIGNLTFTSSGTTGTISGSATTGLSVNVTDSQGNGNFAYTAAVTFNTIDYDTTCDTYFTGGSLDASVTVSGSENGQTDTGFENVGLQFEWSGCDAQVEVVTGTAN